MLNPYTWKVLPATDHEHGHDLCQRNIVYIRVVCKPVQDTSHRHRFEVRHRGFQNTGQHACKDISGRPTTSGHGPFGTDGGRQERDNDQRSVDAKVATLGRDTVCLSREFNANNFNWPVARTGPLGQEPFD